MRAKKKKPPYSLRRSKTETNDVLSQAHKGLKEPLWRPQSSQFNSNGRVATPPLVSVTQKPWSQLSFSARYPTPLKTVGRGILMMCPRLNSMCSRYIFCSRVEAARSRRGRLSSGGKWIVPSNNFRRTERREVHLSRMATQLGSGRDKSPGLKTENADYYAS